MDVIIGVVVFFAAVFFGLLAWARSYERAAIQQAAEEERRRKDAEWRESID